MRTPQQALADAIASGAVQAWIEGKEIQYQHAGKWFLFFEDPSDSKMPPCFTNLGINWRPKPTPTLRPWKPGEVPLDAWFQLKDRSRSITRSKLRVVRFDGVEPFSTGDRFTFAELLSLSDHSTDGGKTWKPCGVMEGGE